MKNRHKIVGLVLLLVLVLNVHTVFAAKLGVYFVAFRDDSGSVKWREELTSSGGSSVNCGFFRTENDRSDVVFCIEPGKGAAALGEPDPDPNYRYDVITDRSRFTELTGYSQELMTRLELIAYYGYGYNGDKSDEACLATQHLLWDEINAVKHQTTYRLVGGDIAAVNNKKAEILNRVNNAYKKPSFDTEELLVGRETSLTDSTGVLSGFTVSKQNNCVARIQGNTLYVTGSSVGKASVTLSKSIGSNGNQPRLLYSPNYQKLMAFGTPSPISITLEFDVIGIPLKITKVDADTKKPTPLGDAKLEGAVYGVFDSVGKEVTRVTLDENGTATTIPLPPDTYTLREIINPEGYNLSKDSYTVVITQEELEPEATVEDRVKRGSLIIYKTLQESDYDKPIPLKGAQFTVKLKSAIGTEKEDEYTFQTNVSGEDGICKCLDLPFGTYVVEETKVPDSALEVDTFEFSITEDADTYVYGTKNGTIQRVEDGETLIDPSKKMKIKIKKQDFDIDLYGKNHEGTYDWTQGDATLKDAEYTIYRKYENGVLSDEVDTITVDHQDEEGYWCAESKYMWTGTYYVKETKRPEGYLIDENVYTFSQDPATQVGEKTTLEKAVENGGLSKEKVERGKVTVDKFDNNMEKTEEVPAKGAKLWLVLNTSVPGGVEGKSSSQIVELAKTNDIIYYETEVDENGDAEFIDKIYKAEYPDAEYTIPYGKYTIIEVAGSEEGAKTHFFAEPQETIVTRQSEKKHYILGEEKVTFYLQIQKMDAVIKKEVNLAGAVFRVWDVAREKYIEQKDPRLGKETKDFVTNEDGKVTLPQKVDAGEYIIYEITPPPGYYSNDEYRLNPEYEGIIGKGGKHVVIDKEAIGIKSDSTGEEVDLYYKAEIEDDPLTGKLQIIKTGEQFTGVDQVTDEYRNKYEVTKPKFENKELEGVKYQIIAAEKILTPDEEDPYIEKGTVVATITTNEDGVAETGELYLGEYEIKEIEAPNGQLINKNIPNVVLKNEGPEKVKTTKVELNNERQRLSVTIDKVFEDVEYSSSKEVEKESVFGIYANEDLKYANGELAISRGTLVATTKVVDGVAQDTDRIDLPEGDYYVKELEASYPYKILEETKNVTLKYEGQEEVLTFEAGQFINEPDTATVTLIKLSTSTLKDVILNGDEVDTSTLDEEIQELVKELSSKTTEEVKAYLKERNVKFVAGAKYGVFVDENCTEPLYMKNEEGQFVVAVMETDDTGLITMENIPLGTYYFKEIEAPDDYELSEDIVKLELNVDSKDAVVYQAIVEEPVKSPGIIKTDAFTGDYVDHCEFVVKDALTGEEIVHSITGTLKDDAYLRDQGRGYIPLDKLVEGRRYTFTEIKAPNIYDLNTEPHEFVAHFDEDGHWATEPVPVENRRKNGKVVVLKTDEKTGEPLEGCKFSIVLLDENGEPYVNGEGETIYLVENAVTDKDGKYVIEEAPYGKYKFIEVEAPEGYEKAEEEMENYVFEVNEKSQEVLFEVTNTGDIAVYALCAVALVSIIGIVYAIKRTKKIAK